MAFKVSLPLRSLPGLSPIRRGRCRLYRSEPARNGRREDQALRVRAGSSSEAFSRACLLLN